MESTIYTIDFVQQSTGSVNYIMKADGELRQDPAAALQDVQSALALTPHKCSRRVVEAHALDPLQRRQEAKVVRGARVSAVLEQSGTSKRGLVDHKTACLVILTDE